MFRNEPAFAEKAVCWAGPRPSLQSWRLCSLLCRPYLEWMHMLLTGGIPHATTLCPTTAFVLLLPLAEMELARNHSASLGCSCSSRVPCNKATVTDAAWVFFTSLLLKESCTC